MQARFALESSFFNFLKDCGRKGSMAGNQNICKHVEKIAQIQRFCGLNGFYLFTLNPGLVI